MGRLKHFTKTTLAALMAGLSPVLVPLLRRVASVVFPTLLYIWQFLS